MNEHELVSTLQKMMQKAYQDVAFHDACLRDPETAFQQASGQALPKATQLHFLEMADNEMIIILPELEAADGELPEAQLDRVVGGDFGDFMNITGKVVNSAAGLAGGVMTGVIKGGATVVLTPLVGAVAPWL